MEGQRWTSRVRKPVPRAGGADDGGRAAKAASKPSAKKNATENRTPTKFVVGNKVKARWRRRRQCFQGKIIKASGDKYDID